MATSSISSPTISTCNCSIGSTSSTDRRQAANRELQNVFTAVLNQAGKEGYVSAESLADNTDMPQQIGDSWHQWFDQFSSTRYSFQAGAESPSVQPDKTATQLRDDYQAILVDAYNQGGYATPEKYLQSLSKAQLKTVQQVHHLAAEIDIGSLSSEGSLNLLLPPGAQVDADHNGLTTVGAGQILQFPSSDTPKDVRDAWQTAIESVPEQDRLTYQLQIMMPLITANLKIDENGQFVRSVEPGDADWTNPMSAPDFSYKQTASNWLSYLDRFKNQMSPEHYARDTNFWTKFREAL